MCVESDDDTPDNTHTQRVLAQYYLSTEGALPPWLPPPPSLSAASSQRPSFSTASSASGSSTYRVGNKGVSLQDIYDSAGPNQQASQPRRNQDIYANDYNSSGRQPLGGDRLRNKLRPTNSRPNVRPASTEEIDVPHRGGSGGYSGRAGLGGGDDYDPYNYNHNYQQSTHDSRRQGQYNSSNRHGQGGRR